MTFKDIISKVRRLVLCGGKDEGRPFLEIGSPTDVRHLDIADSMPCLSKEEIKMIREKSSHDAIRLLSLQSHPPTQPGTPSASTPPSPPQSAPTSAPPSREPSATLLNNASANLPSTVPTPPRQKHSESSPPSFRMKSMWERTRSLSTSLGSHHGGYTELDTTEEDAESTDGGLILDLGCDLGIGMETDLQCEVKEMELDSPVSGKSKIGDGGFEVADTVGGAKCEALPKFVEILPDSKMKHVSIEDDGNNSSTDGEEDRAAVVAVPERRPLVSA